MTAPIVKGWCPGALRPMVSGDGLVVRVRPRAGRLSSEQALGLAALSQRFGNGLIDLSSRANVQLRGVSADGSAALLDGLDSLGLLDTDAAAEARRNVIVAPFWREGDETQVLAGQLGDALVAAKALALPGKFGFAVDCGKVPVLTRDPADIRIERDAAGGLILCADGHGAGLPVTVQSAVPEALELARWFLSRKGGARRMATFMADGGGMPPGFDVPRQPPASPVVPHRTDAGALVALAFGQMSSETLAALGALGPLRTTPWRMVLLEGQRVAPALAELIQDGGDPLLRVIACTGAPRCMQALGETRALARRLSPHVPEGAVLHVSGCAKGCAHPAPAEFVLRATAAGYDLIREGRADGDARQRDLHPDNIPDIIEKAH